MPVITHWKHGEELHSDACLRFLGEDPWKRLRVLREHVKKTKLQMLFRGQNILGYRNYADDVVEYFVQKSIANGIDIIRIFDALNDPRNLKTAIDAQSVRAVMFRWRFPILQVRSIQARLLRNMPGRFQKWEPIRSA